ncbi:MAG: hypothetical protein WB709_09055 [Solirubrobacteraceae bacterium]
MPSSSNSAVHSGSADADLDADPDPDADADADACCKLSRTPGPVDLAFLPDDFSE